MSDESAESVEGTGSPDSHDNPDNPDSTADAGTGRDWSELNGAYGPATEVPEALAGLTDPDLADDAIDDLYSVVLHQGTLYSASGPAVVEVARLLAADRCANPAGALGLVAYYGQCVTEHRAALSFLRAYPRGYRRAEDRLREFQARLDEATDVLAPLLAELDSFDPLEAQALVLLQAQRSRLDSRRAAALSVLARSAGGSTSSASLEDLLARAAAAVRRAAAFALGRHDLSTPDTSEARACALLGRVAGHRADEGDVRALVADWSTAQRVADVCLNELTDDLPDSSLPMWLAITDPRLAAAVLTALPVDAGGASEEVIDALAEAVNRSRGATPPALARLLELAERPAADPDVMVSALRFMPPRPEVRDALARLASRPGALDPEPPPGHAAHRCRLRPRRPGRRPLGRPARLRSSGAAGSVRSAPERHDRVHQGLRRDGRRAHTRAAGRRCRLSDRPRCRGRCC